MAVSSRAANAIVRSLDRLKLSIDPISVFRREDRVAEEGGELVDRVGVELRTDRVRHPLLLADPVAESGIQDSRGELQSRVVRVVVAHAKS